MYYEPSYLRHHGIKGMKWGRRRYQNKDGSLTPAGRNRYADDVREKKTEKENRTPEEIAARRKKALKVGAAVAGTVLAAYGAYKFHDYIRSENGKLARQAGEKAMDEISKTPGIKGLYELGDMHARMGNTEHGFRLQQESAQLAVDHAIKAQREVEKLNFAKATVNVYKNKRRR